MYTFSHAHYFLYIWSQILRCHGQSGKAQNGQEWEFLAVHTCALLPQTWEKRRNCKLSTLAVFCCSGFSDTGRNGEKVEVFHSQPCYAIGQIAERYTNKRQHTQAQSRTKSYGHQGKPCSRIWMLWAQCYLSDSVVTSPFSSVPGKSSITGFACEPKWHSSCACTSIHPECSFTTSKLPIYKRHLTQNSNVIDPKFSYKIRLTSCHSLQLFSFLCAFLMHTVSGNLAPKYWSTCKIKFLFQRCGRGINEPVPENFLRGF